MNSPKDFSSIHTQELCALLPWYINGTLDAKDVKRLEQHLPNCIECQDAVDMDRAIYTSLNEASHVMPRKSDAQALEELWDDLDSNQRDIQYPDLETNDDNVVQLTLRDKVRHKLSNPKLLSAAIAAQFAAIALLIGLLNNTAPNLIGASFQTLSDSKVTAPSNARYRVLFDKTITEASMRDLLHRIGGEIIAGPSSNGVYTIDVTGINTTNVNSTGQNVLQTLRGNQQVLLAELIYTPALSSTSSVEPQ